MGRFFFAVLALVVLIVAILVLAPGLVPVSAFKGRIEAAATDALGRKVTIGDDLSFKIVPRTAFHVNELVIANAEGFAAPHLVRVQEADIGVKLLPLLNRSVEIDRFVLTEPDINLERAENGGVNWNLVEGRNEPGSQNGETGRVEDLQLGDVRIVDGKATYSDAAAGRSYTAEDIDLTARLESLAEPLEAEGTLVFEGAPSRIDMVLTSLEDIIEQKPANLKFDVALGETTAGGDLLVETGDGLSYAGPVNIDAPDLPQFAALIGAPLADGPGFDRLSVEGTAQGGASSIRLEGAAIEFDKIDAAGDLALDWSGAKPKATGALAAGDVDLRPYLPAPTADSRGFPEWSQEKLDLSGLRNIDADINMTANAIYLNDLAFGASRLHLTINDGRLVADIPELGLYGGSGSGQFVVNARQATPSFTGKFDVGAVEAQPFSQALMNIDRLLGLGGFKFDFSATGQSQAAIMQSLDGSGRFDVADGAIKGLNLAELARSIVELQQGGFNPAAVASAIDIAQSPEEETEFSELLSQFAIENGVVNAPTISLTGPLVTMTGAGTVNLPAQTLNLRLLPKASTETVTENGQTFAIPMLVTGTFSEPKIVIDVETLVRGQVEKGLRDFIGGATAPKETQPAEGDETGAAGEEKEPTPEGVATDILKGIFGQPPSKEEEEETSDQPDTEASAGQPSVEKAIASEALKLNLGPKPAAPQDDKKETASQ